MGRDIAAALRVTRQQKGYIEGERDIVTWCIGHLIELDTPESYEERYKSWRYEDLPIIPERFKYHASTNTIDQFKIIKELLNRDDVDTIVNAADAGREGELIFDLVYRQARCKKPVMRLWISSLTRDAIVEGFRNLRPAAEYAGLRSSAHARQQADWLVGLNATRAQTIIARRAGYEGVYSLGRVQTPTLALIVARDREIANFKPTTYYEVVAEFLAAAGRYRGKWFNASGSHISEAATAAALADKVRGQQGAVSKVEKKSVRERAPLLYDLTTLQRAANARYAFSAAHTLEVAQRLYEKKFITYPRTSSRHLSSSVAADLAGHVEAARVGPYVPFIDAILARGALKLTGRHVDDSKVTDHHAIIPTKQPIEPEALSADEKRIYDLVVRRFLAAFFDDAELERTTIITAVAGEQFITRGTVVLKAGWREVDPPARPRASDDDDDEGAELPAVKAKDNVTAEKAEALEKQTKAPPRYNEASLLASMESAGKLVEDEELRLAMKDSGLGTPATRASIIETLIAREYVERDKKALRATAKGEAVIKMLPFALLKSAELTGNWEKRLADMARGHYDPAQFMQEVKEMTREMIKQFGSLTMEQVERPAPPRPDKALSCPKCLINSNDGFLVERSGSMGKFIVCSRGKEACGFISDLPKNGAQRKALLETRCPQCKGAMRLRLPKEKGRAPALICVNYPVCQGVVKLDEKGKPATAQSVAEYGPTCRECGAPTVKRGPFSNNSYFWGCTKWKSDNTGCKAKPVWINDK